MISNNIKISIIIPTFNRSLLLEKLLKNIEKQTYRDFEVIVVNDGSSNLKSYSDVEKIFKKRFKNFKYISNKSNKGAAYSRNQGILSAKFPLIAFADDDDEWLPFKLEKQVEVFKSKWEKVDLVYTWTSMKKLGQIIGKNESTVNGNVFPGIIKNSRIIPYTSTIMVKRECLINVGMFDEKLPSRQDWDLYIRLFKKGYQCWPVKETLVIYHQQEKSISNSPKAYIGNLRIVYKYFYLFVRYSPFSIPNLLIDSLRRKLNLNLRAKFKIMFK